MIKVGIVGGAGYTAGELIRILVNHPEVERTSIASTSNAGQLVGSIHQDLLGLDLKFDEQPNLEVDMLFLCMGHGKSLEFLNKHTIPASTKIIDLSNDFRLRADQKQGDRKFIYGLPEVNKEAIQKASNVANPGCFATAIQEALLPLAANGWLENEVHIHALTGSTGAGQSLSATTHFTWLHDNVSVYKAFTHQHLGEIGETVVQLQPGFKEELSFIPLRGNFTRGIFATLYTKTSKSFEEIKSAYRKYFEEQPFVFISDEAIHLKQVVNTNNVLLHLEKIGDKLLITSIIDNLVKGASGQAVQNMNLMFGLDETTGLKLKATIF